MGRFAGGKLRESLVSASAGKMSNHPVIRRRHAKTMRRRDGLIRFAKDNTSQNGEDGIIERIFQLIPGNNAKIRWCVDVGAWDGEHLSNTHSLLVSPTAGSKRWKGVLIEADKVRFEQLEALHEPLENITLCRQVSSAKDDPNALVSILKPISCLPSDFDFLCIDIDGSDYWALYDLLNDGGFHPQVICIEFNPTMPDDLIYIPSRNDSIRHGASLSALVELAGGFGYVLIETTLYNGFFVQQSLYSAYFSKEVPDTSIEALHEITMGTSLYQLYDGTLKLWGCKKLLWHRIPMDESKMQVLSSDQRVFPFAPETTECFDSSSVIDLSSYCKRDIVDNALRRQYSMAILEKLKEDGFCLVRGLGISQEHCERVLSLTNAFLNQANEDVRRSCLAKDRARRGYSPMNVENFASLIGEKGPNDLVRKFRVGPLEVSDSSKNSLLQPNVWPTADVWDATNAYSFRSAVECFYKEACTASQRIVEAICDGLLTNYPDLERSLKPLRESESHTSILTLLGYRVGSRHKGKNKGPLVAPHTDVGVITMLLFDSGNSATLQRSDGEGGWVDVRLPMSVPDDPIFVVNIADCFSFLCEGKLPSTLHRVVARHGTVPRNCCALFVGLDPEAELEVNGSNMTYEEWRKERIARAQRLLRGENVETPDLTHSK